MTMSLYLRLHILLLALGVVSSPLPEPIAPPPTTLTKTTPPTKPCTTYITKIIPGMWTPTTVYTTTRTVYSQVPCNGCVLATTTLYAPGVGPWGDEPTTTATASVPYNFTSVVCSPSSHIRHPPHLPTDRPRRILGRTDGEETPNNRDPDLTIPHTPRPTTTTTVAGTGSCLADYTIPTGTDGKPTHVITVPAPGRTNPIEPTTTFAIFKRNSGSDHNTRSVPVVTKTITLTLTSKSWSSTTTTTKYTTCYLGPVYQDPDGGPGAIPKLKRDTHPISEECVTTPPPPVTKTTSTHVYKTITVPETGVLTRTAVKCTKTILTRRPKPTPTWSLAPER